MNHFVAVRVLSATLTFVCAWEATSSWNVFHLHIYYVVSNTAWTFYILYLVCSTNCQSVQCVKSALNEVWPYWGILYEKQKHAQTHVHTSTENYSDAFAQTKFILFHLKGTTNILENWVTYNKVANNKMKGIYFSGHDENWKKNNKNFPVLIDHKHKREQQPSKVWLYICLIIVSNLVLCKTKFHSYVQLVAMPLTKEPTVMEKVSFSSIQSSDGWCVSVR